MTRYERVMTGAAYWVAFWRKNPHLFAKQYLHLDLRLFQKILLIMMNYCVTFIMIGARGVGKTFLSAIFCVTRAILYPGSKIVIASGTRGQSINVLEKIILELKPNSPELAAEIDEKQSKINGTNAQIVFYNGSYIKVVTASDSARGNRATLLLIDEFRMVQKDVIDTILRKFLTQRRMPRYSELTKQQKEIEYKKERNKTIYLSSAYFTDHWSYTKCTDTFKFMLDPTRRDFVCGLPYQLSISEGLLDGEAVEEEMLETDFNQIKFAMEYEAVFWGNEEGAFFDFNSVAKNRKIKYPMLPEDIATKLKSDTRVRIQPKLPGEKRILSVDIALMASTKHKNDASALHVTQLMPTKASRYSVNLVYTETNEGFRTEQEALRIRKLYEEFDCDYIVLDVKNLGLSIFDMLSTDISDPDTGEIYPALSCCNNQDVAARCVVREAPKVIWAMNGSAKFNSDCALLLREAFRSGRIRLLENEYDGERELTEIKQFGLLSPQDQSALMLPYINTTLLINELVNLRHEENGGFVKLSEKSGMRKDRYSSLSYNYYVAVQLEKDIRRSASSVFSTPVSDFVFRAPKTLRERW